MKILLIGGTGTISMEISRRLSAEGHELFLLNRGNRDCGLKNVKCIEANIHDEKDVAQKLEGLSFDCAADFIAYTQDDLARDFSLFNGRVKQFIFISSASAYQKPPVNHIITESTPLVNPFWEYSRNKAESERFLMQKFRDEGFPVTIVRPSHTYDALKVPLAIHGKNGSFQVLKRMLEGKPVIIHGDGTSLWTMTHARDFARGFCGLVGNPKAIGQAVQIMSEESMCWNQIYDVIADALGVKLNAVHISSDFLCRADYLNLNLAGTLWGDKAWSVQFDTSKLRSLVPGFKAEISMASGIAETVRNVAAHKELQKPDEEFDLWCDRVIDFYSGMMNSFPF